jgi:hypothetical protein
MPTTFHLYQIIVLAVSFFMLYQGTTNFFKGKSGQTPFKLLVRYAVWGGMLVVTFFPDITFFIAKSVGIIDNINAVILTGFLLIFLMIFKLLSAIERLEQNISELTRKEALKDLSKNNL